jgi:hypothetical protein
MKITLKNPGLKWVEVEGIRFGIGPKTFPDILAGLSESQAVNKDLAGYTAGAVTLIRRIKEWENGPEYPDGSAAPCTEETKNQVFAQRPDLLVRIAEKLSDQEAEVSKNSMSSQDG